MATRVPRWRLFLLILCLSHLAVAGVALGEEEYQRTTVVEPFLEIHTGPAGSYPVFYVAEKGEEIRLLKRRTDWYKVRLSNGKEGWVYRGDIEKTLLAQGRKKNSFERFYDNHIPGRLAMGWGVGTFGGDPSLYVRADYLLIETIKAEIDATFVSGDEGTTQIYGGGIVIVPYRGRWLSLSGMMGAGILKSTPSDLLINASGDTSPEAHAGIGVSIRLVRNLLLDGQFRNFTVFSSTDNTQEFQEYSLGLSFQF
jgi:Bacterial SH3 domain